MLKAVIFCLIGTFTQKNTSAPTPTTPPQSEQSFEGSFRPVVKSISDHKYHTLLLVQKYVKTNDKPVIIK